MWIGAVLAVLAASCQRPAATPSTSYDPAGKLVLPAGYRSWVYLTSGIDMSYRKDAPTRTTSVFDNVFVDPPSYARFLETGHWPEGTTLVLEQRSGADHGSIVHKGAFQNGDVIGLEVHVKDAARFPASTYPDGWGFYSFDDRQPTSAFGPKADCYDCHHDHGALDSTFAQFYPTILPVGAAKGTLSGRE